MNGICMDRQTTALTTQAVTSILYHFYRAFYRAFNRAFYRVLDHATILSPNSARTKKTPSPGTSQKQENGNYERQQQGISESQLTRAL